MFHSNEMRSRKHKIKNDKNFKPSLLFLNDNNNYPATNQNESPKSLSGCNENINQYLINSTLHGLRYVGDRNISICERIFYMVAFVIVFILSAYFISNIWDKWSASPIIIGFNAITTSIHTIPFPAVTICNMNQAKYSIAKKVYKNTLDDSLLQSLCAKELLLSNNETTTTTPESSKINIKGKWTSFRQFLLKTSQSCKDTLIYCKYATHIEQCQDIFDTSLTDEGLCCTFNTVHPKYLLLRPEMFNELDDEIIENNNYEPVDWTPETGYQEKILHKNSYPRPAAGTGSHFGLTIVLNADVNEYYCSSTNSFGFKLLLHNPTETPKIKQYGIAVAPGSETRIIITPKISDASIRLRKIQQNVRQCIFANEGNLTYFRTYSRKNCEMECESRFIEEQCGCILYYMPRTTENSTICKQSDKICYEKLIIDRGSLLEIQNNTCNCMPACFELNYSPEISTSILGNGKFSMQLEVLEKMNASFVQKNIAVIHIYYEDNSFRSLIKEELIGFTEFLSNTGGLLGLFMGFSMISFIEIFYFITIRPYCSQKRLNIKATTQSSWIKTTKRIIRLNNTNNNNTNNKLISFKTPYPYLE